MYELKNKNLKPENLEKAKKIIIDKGGEYLGGEYLRADCKNIQCQCVYKHKWITSTRGIISGDWCPECRYATPDDLKNRIIDAQNIALKNKGKLLTTSINKLTEKLTWQCSCGHIWKAYFFNVATAKTWCPECYSFSSERICKKALSLLIGCEFKKIRPDWLRLNKRNLELDGYCESLGIAFEHNGKQHYQQIKGFERCILEDIQKRDVFKYNRCKELGIKLIIIPALIDLLKPKDLISFLKDQCKILGIAVNDNELLLDELYLEKYTNTNKQEILNEVIKIAESKGGKCLSDEYICSNLKLKFQCGCGFEWKTVAGCIKKGHWCPKCAPQNKTKFTIQDIITFCKTLNINCLSDSYKNNTLKLDFQCSLCNCKWSDGLNNLKSRPWCPCCKKKEINLLRKIKIETYKEIAEKKGGKCLSNDVKNSIEKLKWECENGHIWMAKGHAIKIGKQWCPECYKLKRSSGKSK